MGPALRGCLSAGITESVPAVDDPSWEREADTILASRLEAVALQALHAEGDDHEPGVATSFRSAMLNDAARSLSIESNAREPLLELQKNDIPFAVIKGPAVARFYADPDTRFYSDIDILVPPDHYARAIAILTARGFHRREGHIQPWPWFELVCVEGANVYDSNGGNIDVHHHLSPWAFSQKLQAADLLGRSDEGTLAGLRLRFASAGDCLSVACLHVLNDLWKEDPSFQSWRDICTMMTVLGPVSTHDALARSGLAWFEPIAQAALQTIVSPGSAAGTRWRRSQVLKHWRLKSLGWDGSTVLARHPAGWLFRLPLWRALVFIAGGLVPSPKYVHSRHHGYWSYWRDSLQSVREAAGGKDVR
jgi:hypothetical protein